MYSKYKDSGLEIIAFPCNDFGSQEPGNNSEIAEFAHSKDVTFSIMSKISDINEDPLFTWLRSHSPGHITGPVTWNFHKFLVDRNGRVGRRYGSDIHRHVIEKDIYELLVAPYDGGAV